MTDLRMAPWRARAVGFLYKLGESWIAAFKPNKQNGLPRKLRGGIRGSERRNPLHRCRGSLLASDKRYHCQLLKGIIINYLVPIPKIG